MSTVESYQANLEGLGIVLLPTAFGEISPFRKRIDDTYIYELDPRVFESANSGAPVKMYRRDHLLKCWFLV